MELYEKKKYLEDKLFNLYQTLIIKSNEYIKADDKEKELILEDIKGLENTFNDYLVNQDIMEELS